MLVFKFDNLDAHAAAHEAVSASNTVTNTVPSGRANSIDV